jgi:hypothetical protein
MGQPRLRLRFDRIFVLFFMACNWFPAMMPRPPQDAQSYSPRRARLRRENRLFQRAIILH